MNLLCRTLSVAFVAYALTACTADPAVPGVEADSGLVDTLVIDSTRPDTAAPDTSIAETSADTSIAETSTEAAPTDAATDTAIDSAVVDTTAVDTNVVDSSATDTKVEDTAVADTGVADTAVADTAVADTAVADTAVADTAVADTLVADAADTAPEAIVDSGMCNNLVNIGTATPITTMAGATPTGVGGTIVDGIYKLTEFKTYTGSGIKGIVFRSTIEILSGGTRAAQVAQNSDKPEFRSSETIVTAGVSISITTTCDTETPPVVIPYNTFTATPTTLTLFCSIPPYNFSVTYTKP